VASIGRRFDGIFVLGAFGIFLFMISRMLEYSFFALIFLNAVYLSGGSYVIVTKKKCHGLQRQTSTLFKWLKKKALDFIHGNTQQSTVE
jgi:hypothetical protein